MKIQLHDFVAGKSLGEIEVNDSVFNVDPKEHVLHRMVRWQLAKRQQGTHSKKTRAEVGNSRKKQGPQKGSGGARHGDKYSNIFRGGGLAHAPKMTDHSHELTKKFRSLGLRHALSLKQKAGELIIVDDFALQSPKTQQSIALLSQIKANNSLFIFGDTVDANFKHSIANLPFVDALPTMGANVYDILNHNTLVLTRSAVEKLTERLS